MLNFSNIVSVAVVFFGLSTYAENIYFEAKEDIVIPPERISFNLGVIEIPDDTVVWKELRASCVMLFKASPLSRRIRKGDRFILDATSVRSSNHIPETRLEMAFLLESFLVQGIDEQDIPENIHTSEQFQYYTKELQAEIGYDVLASAIDFYPWSLKATLASEHTKRPYELICHHTYEKGFGVDKVIEVLEKGGSFLIDQRM